MKKTVSKILLRMIALTLGMALLFSLTACKNTDTSSEPDESSQIVLNEPSDVESSEEDTSSDEEITSSKPQGNSNNVNTNNKTVFAADPYSDIPKSLVGTTVKFAVWYKMPQYEKDVIAAFEKKTGIKVEIVQAATTADYKDKIVSLMAANTPPDVVLLSGNNFPVWTRQVFQPLNPKIFRLDDPIWDKEQMDLYKVNGKYYGLNIAGNWQNETAHVLYYNSDMLTNNGIKTPRELWKNNNWNWDTLETTLRDIKKYVPNVMPLSFYNGSSILASSGTDFMTFDGTKLASNTADKRIVTAFEKLNGWAKDGLSTPINYYADELSSGKCAMMCGIMFGMKKEGGWWSADGGLRSGTIDAVPFPSPKGQELTVPIEGKLFGVPKGAKNAQGAAYFLRYFLDPKNYDMNNMFLNDNLKDTFNAVLKAKKVPMYSYGPLTYIKSSANDEMIAILTMTDVSQVQVALDKNKNIIENAVKRVNQQVFGIK